MTSTSPVSIWHACEAFVLLPGVGRVDLPVIDIEVSEDEDRENYTEATITCEWLEDDVFAHLDPRAQRAGPTAPTLGPVFWRIAQYSGDPAAPTFHGYLPGIGVDAAERATHARMWVREATREDVEGITVLEVAGAESMLSDKRRIATTWRGTGATTVADLVVWSLNDVLGEAALSGASDAAIATPIPEGERRSMEPGETHMDLIKPELDALNLRFYDRYGFDQIILQRGVTRGGTFKLATYTHAEGAPLDADPIVTSCTERLSRDRSWADAVLLKIDLTERGGGVTYVASDAGVNTRGQVVTVNRPMPASTAHANALSARARMRGREVLIEARMRFDVRSAYALQLYTRRRAQPLTVTVRSVRWNTATGTMTIRGVSGSDYV